MLVRVTRLNGAIALIFSLLASSLIQFAAPVRAEAFSNVTSFSLANSTVYVEDVALCTSFKYPFDPNSLDGTRWNQVGYETCPSESLTTSKLPATLHYKVRIESRAPEQFQLSSINALITDGKGRQVSTAQWAPAPLVNVDGPVNINNARFYGAFSLPNSTIFPEDSYTLTIQLWNARWANIYGPTVQTEPDNLKIFAFNIYPGQPAAPQPIKVQENTCNFDKGFTDARMKIASATDAKLSYLSALTDFGAPGLYEQLKSWGETLAQDSVNLTNLRTKADATYGKLGVGITCDDYLQFIAESTATEAKISQTRTLLAAYLAKAQKSVGSESAKNEESDFCRTQGTAALTSIKNSDAVLYKIQSQLGKFDTQQNAAADLLNEWSKATNSELQNLLMWIEKIPVYQKQDSSCSSFQTALGSSKTLYGKYESLPRQIVATSSKVQTNPKSGSTQKEEKFAEVEAEEEIPAANLSVTYSKSLARYILKVESNLPDETLTIRATKKGSRSLKFSIDTDEDGAGGIRTTTKLAGYTMALYFGKEQLDRVTVK